jgi:hypothetical protein
MDFVTSQDPGTSSKGLVLSFIINATLVQITVVLVFMSEQEDFAKAASLFASKPAVEAAEKDMFADSDGDDMFADSDGEGADKPKPAAKPGSAALAGQPAAKPAGASAAQPTTDAAATTGTTAPAASAGASAQSEQ